MGTTAAERKKHREAQLVNAFFRLAGLSGRIIEEREAPDFLIEVDAKVVGLEVSELFIRSDGNAIEPKAKESVISRVVAEARQLYESKGGKPLHVSIGFSLGDDAPRVERKQTAVAIAEYLLKLDPPIDQLVEWTPSHRRDPLPHCIRFLRILAVPDPAMAHWTAPQAGWVAPLTEELVQACVDDKVGKLLHYRSVAPTTWLLIAVEGRAPSQFFDRRPNIRSEAIRSPFDATYLLNLIESSVQRLSFAHDA